MKKRKISLMLKVMVLCGGLILVSSLAIHLFAFRTARITIEDTIGQMSLNIVRSVADTIDGDQLEKLQSPEDMETEYYKELRNDFINIVNETGLEYLYTMARSGDGTFYYVIDGTEFGSEDESLIGDTEDEITDKMAACMDGIESYEYDDSDWGALISGYVPIKNSKGDIIGILAADFDASCIKENLAKARRSMLLMVGIVFVAGLMISMIFTNLIVRSIKRLNEKVRSIEDGDLTIVIEENRSDEVGSLADSFRKMLRSMSTMIRNIHTHSEVVFQAMDSLNANIDVSNRATQEITKVIAEIASGAVNQVESIEMVEASMQNVFAEVETITRNIDSVNDDSDLTLKDMQEASDKLKHSAEQINLVNDTVEKTASMMTQLEDKFKEVLSFSDSVARIAARTNLLALNASIEAASAGEHGRGFAVVAGEINNLAKQSREASQRINQLIVAVQEEISQSSKAIGNGAVQARNGVNVMSQVELHLGKLSASNQKMNARLKEIRQAIAHIDEDCKMVLDKTSLLADIARDLSAGTQQTAAETQEQNAILEGIRNDLFSVKAQVEELNNTVNRFKIEA